MLKLFVNCEHYFLANPHTLPTVTPLFHLNKAYLFMVLAVPWRVWRTSFFLAFVSYSFPFITLSPKLIFLFDFTGVAMEIHIWSNLVEIKSFVSVFLFDILFPIKFEQSRNRHYGKWSLFWLFSNWKETISFFDYVRMRFLPENFTFYLMSSCSRSIARFGGLADTLAFYLRVWEISWNGLNNMLPQ